MSAKIIDNLFTFPSCNFDIMNALFDSVDDGVLVSDNDGKIIFGNDAVFRINDNEELPSDPKERIQHYTSRFGDAEIPLKMEELPITKALYEGTVSGQEIILTSAKGQKKYLSCNGRALYNSDGVKVGALLILRDNTFQQKIQSQKNDLEVEQARLMHLNAELERFSAVAAHDLKSPLNSITQYAELLNEEYGSKLGIEGSQLLQVMMNAGNRLRALIDDLLTYARAGNDLGELTMFDSRLLVDEVLGLLNGEISKESATLEIGFLPVIHADRVGITQVFQNLISNALKYRSESSPVIKIKAIDENDCWSFQIEDNGMGIQLEDQKSAFDLFKRFQVSQKVEGTGLGLPICKRIIEFHGGKLSLESEKNIGTKFIFTLPKSIPITALRR